jgi:hypothetical protein
MIKKGSILLILVVLLVSSLVGCAGATPTTAPTQVPATSVPPIALTEPPAAPTEASATQPAASTVALKITGKVANELSLTEAEVHAMPTMEAQSTNKQGEVSTYTGVLLTKLLDEAGVQPDATSLVFVADDGFIGEVALADVQACNDCILSFRNQGGFSSVLPGFPGSLQVKGVVEIQVK